MEELVVYSDTNWASCRRTRRSTSGGVVRLGGAGCFGTLCSWSRTQATVALSSTEAEYIGAVTACSEGLFLQAMLGHCGYHIPMTILMDSSGARAVAHRQGAGRVKHLEMRSLWLQGVVLAKRVKIEAVGAKDNTADALTKALPAQDIDRHLKGLGMVKNSGENEE